MRENRGMSVFVGREIQEGQDSGVIYTVHECGEGSGIVQGRVRAVAVGKAMSHIVAVNIVACNHAKVVDVERFGSFGAGNIQDGEFPIVVDEPVQGEGVYRVV